MKRRAAFLLLLLVAAEAFGVVALATARRPCVARLLVLSAYPGEIDRNLTATRIQKTVVIDGRSFYVGRLRGNDVVLALTGIGLVNAENTARTALRAFRCGSATAISGIVFSGVAGGRSNIGDVTVPARWTFDEQDWMPVDAQMFAVAQAAIAKGVTLESTAALGDLACLGLDPGLVKLIPMPNEPRIITGGDGKSADPFNGRAFPCIPGGGDVFGCSPCRAPDHLRPPDLLRFLQDAAPFVDPDFFTGYFENPTPSTTEFDAEDMETAAVAHVATENGIPFIAFRAMSDGNGDPLMLPGFPFQFFVYRQIAADNAAAVTLAFLEEWSSRA